PGVVLPVNLVFPLQQAANNARRIESSIDRGVQSPINYSWNVTYGRQLPEKMYLEVSYIGRAARHLLATRDVMTPNNITDPKSGMTWYEAATALEIQRRSGVPVSQIKPLPFFENLWAPGSLDPIFYANATPLSNTQVIYAA